MNYMYVKFLSKFQQNFLYFSDIQANGHNNNGGFKSYPQNLYDKLTYIQLKQYNQKHQVTHMITYV